jgi:hypothetical protein
MKNWKACERRIAKLLGGTRVPVSGHARDDSPDIRHDRLSIEVKSRRKLPAWIEDAMKQAEVSAKDGQLPVAVLHQDGRKYWDAFVLIRLSEFAKHMTGGGGIR